VASGDLRHLERELAESSAKAASSASGLDDALVYSVSRKKDYIYMTDQERPTMGNSMTALKY
jgi:hypothetical protein